LTNPVTKQFGTNKADLIRKISIDNNNNIYAVGYTYGNYNGSNNSDPTFATADVFVQKFDQNLNFLTSKQFGTPHEERGYCFLKDSILFIGGITEGSIKSANLGSFDGFVLALNTSDLSYNSNPVLAIAENAINEQIKFYPNPTSDILTFEVNKSKDYQFSVHNQLGQLIKVGILNNSIKTISLADLNSGLYFINLKSDTFLKTIKVIKN
jgi:hypothetical protein